MVERALTWHSIVIIVWPDNLIRVRYSVAIVIVIFGV